MADTIRRVGTFNVVRNPGSDGYYFNFNATGLLDEGGAARECKEHYLITRRDKSLDLENFRRFRSYVVNLVASGMLDGKAPRPCLLTIRDPETTVSEDARGSRHVDFTATTVEPYEPAAPAGEGPAPGEALVGRFRAAFRGYHGTGGCIPHDDIVNLYLCLSQGFLTVLSGEPGNGKTSTCAILSRALGLDADGRYVQLSVEKDWSSKRDLIGYYNALSGEVDKSNRRVYDALAALDAEWRGAEGDPLARPPFILALDEANLSPMEYYWSDFMAACDNPVALCRAGEGDAPVFIDIGDRSFAVQGALRFMATINNDDTTARLSPRLMDRAWIVTMAEEDADDDAPGLVPEGSVSMAELQRAFGVGAGNEAPGEARAWLDRHWPEVRGWFADGDGLGMPVSRRVDRQIREFCLAGAARFAGDAPEDRARTALDYAVRQKLLPRIDGYSEEFGGKLAAARSLLEGLGLARSAADLDRIVESGKRHMHYYSFFRQ